MKPNWLSQFEEYRQGRSRGFVLDGNTADKVFSEESGLRAIPLRYFLAAQLNRDGYAVGCLSFANGFEEMRPPTGVPAGAKSPFQNLPNNLPLEQILAHATRWLRNDQHKVALILDYADHMTPASNGMNAMANPTQLAAIEIIHSWGLDETIRRTKNLVFLISYESQISELLLRSGVGYKLLNLTLPNVEEREAYLQHLSTEPEIGEGLHAAEGLPVSELARLTSGLPLVEIEELALAAALRRAPLDRESIRERKAAVIHQLCQGLLEVHEPRYGFDAVSGLAHAKEELRRLVHTIQVSPASATAALLLVGVPGCGKSFLVQALAYELGYPCLAMRLVRDSWVGSSERNLERVLAVAETLAPCLIWQDEIDQVLGQRNTGQSMDAGTSERMMGRIWEFMGSMKHRGKILWVGTSNRPDVLDSALLDRFQLVIPFLHPTPSETEELLPALALQLGRQLASGVNCRTVAHAPTLQQPTVRALQEVVARAATLVAVDTGSPDAPIDQAHLEEAAYDYKPNYDRLQHQFIALNALRMTSFSSLLPWRSRAGLREGAEIPDYMEGLVDPASGELNQASLLRRLGEIAAALHQQQRFRQF